MWCSASPKRSRSWCRARCSRKARRNRSWRTNRCAPSILAKKATTAERGEGAMAEAALALEGVFAGYGETVVLENIRLALAPGETLSVIGRNGVGKSTLLATIMGHTTLHGGSINLRGKDISQSPTYRRATAGLGYVPQEREIFPSLSVRENLAVAARPGPWTVEKVYELFP